MLSIDQNSVERKHHISALRAFLNLLNSTQEVLHRGQIKLLLGADGYRHYLDDLKNLTEERRAALDVSRRLTGNAADYWERLNRLRKEFPTTRKGQAKLTVRQENTRFRVFDEAQELAEFFATQLTDAEKHFFCEPDVNSRKYDSILRLNATLWDLRDGLDDLPHLQQPELYLQREALQHKLDELAPPREIEVAADRSMLSMVRRVLDN